MNQRMPEPADDLEKIISSLGDFDDEEPEDTDEFDMEAYWDADRRPTRWEWEDPWTLEPRDA